MFEKNFYCVSSRVENSSQLYGCFKIGPFFGHQSLTFANALRRTLLADRNRCTFDAIQIYGVEHEFSSLMGVRESVIDILLNLEKLNFQITRPITKPQVAFLNVCGPGILRAHHLHLPSSLKCIVPEQYIATLEINGRLTLKLFFSPNWDKFQYNIQNQLWNKNTSEQTWHRDAMPRYKSGAIKYNQHHRETQKKIDRQIPVRKNLVGAMPRIKYFLKHQPILQKKIRQPVNLPAQANPSIQRIFNNRLKIIHYLTNTLFSSNQDHLQLLFVQFQFWHCSQPMPNLHHTAMLGPGVGCRAMGVFAKQLPLSEKLKKYRTQKHRCAMLFVGAMPRIKYFLLKSKNKKIEKKKLAFLKTKSKIKKQKVPIFTQKIRENFLFLKSSFCTIKKVNYTLQSFDFRSNLTSLEKTINNSDQPRAGQNDSQKAANCSNKNPTVLTKANRSRLPLDLNCTLKLNAVDNEYPISQSKEKRADSCTHNTKPPKSHPLLTTKQLGQAPDLDFIPSTEWTALDQRSKLELGQRTHASRFAMNRTPPNTKIKLLTSKKKEFILFEVWTDGSLHPQTAILNAINELLFEIFPYASRSDAFEYEKVHPIPFHKIRSLKRRGATPTARKHFREKFLNLEIGNFHFDLDTYLFLKKIKIYRIIDFINFFSKKRNQRQKKNKILDKNLNASRSEAKGLQSMELQYTDEIKMTLNRFQIFIHSVLALDPVIPSS